MIDLGTLGGTFVEAIAVNDRGQVVGYSYLPEDITAHPFSWTEAGRSTHTSRSWVVT
jgi:hypothetical protein